MVQSGSFELKLDEVIPAIGLDEKIDNTVSEKFKSLDFVKQNEISSKVKEEIKVSDLPEQTAKRLLDKGKKHALYALRVIYEVYWLRGDLVKRVENSQIQIGAFLWPYAMMMLFSIAVAGSIGVNITGNLEEGLISIVRSLSFPFSPKILIVALDILLVSIVIFLPAKLLSRKMTFAPIVNLTAYFFLWLPVFFLSAKYPIEWSYDFFRIDGVEDLFQTTMALLIGAIVFAGIVSYLKCLSDLTKRPLNNWFTVYGISFFCFQYLREFIHSLFKYL